MFGNQNMQNDSSKTIKLILAIGLVTAALIASAGVFYYYAIFVPSLEQQKLDLEKQKLKEKQDAEAKALKKKEQDAEQRAQGYQTCIDNAETAYTSNWNSACQKLSEHNQVAFDNCMSNPSIINNQFMGKAYCEKQYGATEFDPECTLPGNTADGIERARTERRDACMAQAQQALY
ncbi:hypothetical protein [Acinetobacter bohemicus]|uniref:hypothetical protein n=1 Tax=Acinetobacter bohemicus TaxID=1435036 RepID=UPI003FA1FEC0